MVKKIIDEAPSKFLFFFSLDDVKAAAARVHLISDPLQQCWPNTFLGWI